MPSVSLIFLRVPGSVTISRWEKSKRRGREEGGVRGGSAGYKVLSRKSAIEHEKEKKHRVDVKYAGYGGGGANTKRGGGGIAKV